MIRRWGRYWVLFSIPWLKLKILRFNPLSSLSFQKHFCRSELWIGLKGAGDLLLLDKDGNDFWRKFKRWDICLIRRLQWHQFINRSNKPVYILEMQFGSKIAEDDIIRK